MSDQQAATEQPVDSPQQGTDTTQEAAPQVPAGYIPENDYKELQAWNTREAQWRSANESTVSLVQAAEQGDAEAQKALLDRLGYTLPEDEDEDTSAYEPDPQLRAELEELKQWKESLTKQEQQERHYADYREEYDPQINEMGVPEAFRDMVADLAYNHFDAVHTPQGLKPDLQGAWNQVLEVLKMGVEVPEVQSVAKQKWASTKPRTAFTTSGGGEGTQVLDTSKHENRVAYALSRLPQNHEQ